MKRLDCDRLVPYGNRMDSEAHGAPAVSVTQSSEPNSQLREGP